MSEYFFGLHEGHLKVQADQIAKKIGGHYRNCGHVNYTDPGTGQQRGWFYCPNLGHPFDAATEKAVMSAISDAGGIGALRRKK